MPGQRFWAPKIEDIDPEACLGYSNAVILCGINDLRQPDVTCERDIRNIFNSLSLKIKQIKQLNRKCFVYVCPLLPTKDADLNRRVNCFNRMLLTSITSMGVGVQCVQGFHGFAEHSGMLASQLSKSVDRFNRPDTLHLNFQGCRVLAGLIKQAIFFRLHNGVDRRKGRTSRVNGRSFSSVASGPPPPRRDDRGRHQVW